MQIDNDNKTLKQVADTITGKSIDFEIIIQPQNSWHRWLQKRGWKPKKKLFSMQPIVLGNLLRISRLLLTIDPEKLKGSSFQDTCHHLISDHTETVMSVLAIAIQNTRKDPDQSLIRLIGENLAPAEALKLLTFVLAQMDLKNFISSIISIRGLNVLERDDKKKNANEVSPLMTGS